MSWTFGTVCSFLDDDLWTLGEEPFPRMSSIHVHTRKIYSSIVIVKHSLSIGLKHRYLCMFKIYNCNLFDFCFPFLDDDLWKPNEEPFPRRA